MSNFDDDFAAAALPDLFDEQGDSVGYTPKGGVLASMTGIVGAEEVKEENTESGRVKVRSLSVSVTTDPTGSYGGVSDPQLNATVTIDSEEWPIANMKPIGPGYVDLMLERRESIERSRRGYRG